MNVDRARFLALATSMMACHGDHLAPDNVTVAPPREVGRPPTDDTEAEPAPALSAPESTATRPASLGPRCRDLKGPSSACESIDDTRSLCEGLTTALEPDTAERTVRCLEALAGTDSLCRYDAAPRCFVEASTDALVDLSTRAPCREAVDHCAGARWAGADLSVDSCSHAASAVHRERRDRLLSCVRESCGVARCLYEVVR